MGQLERLIKSADRVKQHGEVFTPQWMVDKMLAIEEIKAATKDIHATFLEPSTGEGVFLTSILKQKLDCVKQHYATTLTQYEHYASYALTTLYGIELLEDNADLCRLNLVEVFTSEYREQCIRFKSRVKIGIIRNAYAIVWNNVIVGNFLTRQTIFNQPIVVPEWTLVVPINLNKPQKTLRIIRTDYTLDDMEKGNTNIKGHIYGKINDRDAYCYEEKSASQLYKMGVIKRERRDE